VNFSLPYSRTRRYLTGTDWVMGVLHREACRRRPGGRGAGAISQVVLALRGALSEEALRSAVEAVGRRLPLIQGRVARDWLNLAPFWKAPGAFRPERVRVVDLPAEAEARVRQLLCDHVNTPLGSETEHVSFLLMRQGASCSQVAMVFDHRLLDAWGAEKFLQLLDETWRGRLEEVAPRIRQTEPAHLDHWGRRFKAGRMLGKVLGELKREDACGLAEPGDGASRRVAFVHDSLSAEASRRFADVAEGEIGAPILLPAAAARAVLALQRAIPEMPLPGNRYLLFTTLSTRAPGNEWESLFFNPFTFMPFSVEKLWPGSAAELGVVLRDQLFEMMRCGLPDAMQDATALGRICPPGLLGRIMRSAGAGRVCTMYFACLRETGFTSGTFLGLPVENLIHTPLAFSPPGINLCMTGFRGGFNLVLSYVEGSLTREAAQAILREFKATLQ
jgi:hypothetical protein